MFWLPPRFDASHASWAQRRVIGGTIVGLLLLWVAFAGARATRLRAERIEVVTPDVHLARWAAALQMVPPPGRAFSSRRVTCGDQRNLTTTWPGAPAINRGRECRSWDAVAWPGVDSLPSAWRLLQADRYLMAGDVALQRGASHEAARWYHRGLRLWAGAYAETRNPVEWPAINEAFRLRLNTVRRIPRGHAGIDSARATWLAAAPAPATGDTLLAALRTYGQTGDPARLTPLWGSALLPAGWRMHATYVWDYLWGPDRTTDCAVRADDEAAWCVPDAAQGWRGYLWQAMTPLSPQAFARAERRLRGTVETFYATGPGHLLGRDVAMELFDLPVMRTLGERNCGVYWPTRDAIGINPECVSPTAKTDSTRVATIFLLAHEVAHAWQYRAPAALAHWWRHERRAWPSAWPADWRGPMEVQADILATAILLAQGYSLSEDDDLLTTVSPRRLRAAAAPLVPLLRACFAGATIRIGEAILCPAREVRFGT